MIQACHHYHHHWHQKTVINTIVTVLILVNNVGWANQQAKTTIRIKISSKCQLYRHSRAKARELSVTIELVNGLSARSE